MQPVSIPSTKPTRYVSFNRALNLRTPDETTGDWHPLTAFFVDDDAIPVAVNLAGEGESVDTTPSLAARGVRDMSAVLATAKVVDTGIGPVYVANHYRAIADLAMSELAEGWTPRIVTVETINQWLDTEEQVAALVSDYLAPLRAQLSGEALRAFETWFPTIRYQ